ncbi:MAG TPA: transketolase [Gaiellaceae bacterium]|jgi:transketolase|nr:transketolase [Gaiellaceae bacterium]
MNSDEKLTALAQAIRRTVLQQSKRANVGHIGSCLSVADILAAVYGGALRPTAPADPDRDRFVMSKGHAALALYAALAATGRLDADLLDSFCADGSPLATHPEQALEQIEFSTGSLGHGLPLGAGAALAARIQKSERRVYVLLSDAELNEGSTWEAVMFAAHHRLSNLVAIVDLNGQQALGATKEILDPGNPIERFRAFGWDQVEVDGHDAGALLSAMTRATAGPNAVLACTTFGKGVSFMERTLAWHYMPMSDEEFEHAMAEVAS